MPQFRPRAAPWVGQRVPAVVCVHLKQAKANCRSPLMQATRFARSFARLRGNKRAAAKTAQAAITAGSSINANAHWRTHRYQPRRATTAPVTTGTGGRANRSVNSLALFSCRRSVNSLGHNWFVLPCPQRANATLRKRTTKLRRRQGGRPCAVILAVSYGAHLLGRAEVPGEVLHVIKAE